MFIRQSSALQTLQLSCSFFICASDRALLYKPYSSVVHFLYVHNLPGHFWQSLGAFGPLRDALGAPRDRSGPTSGRSGDVFFAPSWPRGPPKSLSGRLFADFWLFCQIPCAMLIISAYAYAFFANATLCSSDRALLYKPYSQFSCSFFICSSDRALLYKPYSQFSSIQLFGYMRSSDKQGRRAARSVKGCRARERTE